MSVLITSTRAPFCIKSPEGDLPFFRREDFSGFFPEPFLGAIVAAAAIITAIITAITIITTIAIATLVIVTINATAIGSTPIKVKAFPFKETF